MSIAEAIKMQASAGKAFLPCKPAYSKQLFYNPSHVAISSSGYQTYPYPSSLGQDSWRLHSGVHPRRRPFRSRARA